MGGSGSIVPALSLISKRARESFADAMFVTPGKNINTDSVEASHFT
jgi:hypothetical protein